MRYLLAVFVAVLLALCPALPGTVSAQTSGSSDNQTNLTSPTWAKQSGPRAQAADFYEEIVASEFQSAYSVYASDIDNDADIDIVATASLLDQVVWYEHTDDGWEQQVIDDWLDYPSAVSAVDIDGDGDVDVVTGAFYGFGENVNWHEQTPDGWVRHRISQTTFVGTETVCTVDMDQDGDYDVIAGSYEPNEVRWWENDGEGNFSQHILPDHFSWAHKVCAADLNGDGNMDIVASGRDDDYSGLITWWEQDDFGSFEEHILFLDPDDDGPFVCTMDLDSDGDIDIVSTLSSSEDLDPDIVWWENDGEGNFSQQVVTSDFNNAGGICAVDIEADGDVDIVCGGFQDSHLFWWENDGNQGFTPHTLSEEIAGIRSIFISDVDGNGEVDVLSGGIETDDIRVWYQGFSNVVSPTEPLLAQSFQLMPAYPNPFNSSTQVQVTLPQPAQLQVTVYNLVGSRVAVLYNGQAIGLQRMNFDASRLAGGIYFIRASVPGQQDAVQKVTLIK